MSCTFWNMRRRMRKQLGIEREVKEEIVTADDMVNVKPPVEPKKPAKKPVKKAGEEK